MGLLSDAFSAVSAAVSSQVSHGRAARGQRRAGEAEQQGKGDHRRVGARIDRGWRLPSGFAYQTTRTETGMPSRVIRLCTLHPIFVSVR